MNQPQQFIDPMSGTGEKVDFTQYVGALVLIEPKKIEREVQTQNGLSDAVVADVSFIHETAQPVEFVNTFIFTTAIKGKVEDHLGSMVLGRVIGATSKQGRPYADLQPASDADKQLAGRYVAHREQQRASQQFQGPSQGQPPAAPAQPPQQPQGAPQGWGQAPAQPQQPAPQQPPPGWPQQPSSAPPF